jgi:uncharacterized protein YoxC
VGLIKQMPQLDIFSYSFFFSISIVVLAIFFILVHQFSSKVISTSSPTSETILSGAEDISEPSKKIISKILKLNDFFDVEWDIINNVIQRNDIFKKIYDC